MLAPDVAELPAAPTERERERDGRPSDEDGSASMPDASAAPASACPPFRQCSFFLARKDRCCRMEAARGSSLCAQHGGSGRVACPHCSTSVAACALTKHMRKCPAATQQRERDAQPWHVPGANAAPVAAAAAATTAQRAPSLAEFSAAELARALAAVDAALAGEGWDGELQGGVRRPTCAERLLADTAAGRAIGGGDGHVPQLQRKHATQTASVLGHMLERSVLAPRRRPAPPDGKMQQKEIVCVELCAGRGYLSMMVAQGGPKRFVLIDRQVFRNKADRSLRALGCSVERLKADLRDMDLRKVAALHNRAAVVVGKHLCGVATDYSLRCAVALAEAEGERVLAGVALAPCCHHRCLYREYVNVGLLHKYGIDERLFQAITKLSSWGTTATPSGGSCEGEGADEGGDGEGGHTLTPVAGTAVAAAALKLDEAARIAAGVRCKRLLDYGRLQWLRQQLAQKSGCRCDAELVKYAEATMSPENRLMLAALASATEAEMG